MTERAASRPWGEREGWLSLLEDLFDPSTIERLERLGVGPGWQALEAGAGSGSIALWLSRRVGPEGRVVATDVDTRFLDRLPARPNLRVLRHDLGANSFPPQSFDLIHARAVLVHLEDGEGALARMAGWLKPGGVLLTEEPWVDAGLLAPDPAMSLLAEALKEFMDGALAPRLPLAMREAGLERVGAEGELAFFDGGSELAAFNRGALARQLDELVAAGRVDREAGEGLLARFDDPSWSAWSRPRLAAWGRRPAEASPAAEPAGATTTIAANGWAAAETEQSIAGRFEQQAQRDPGKTAVVGSCWSPSYSELDAAANRIAAELLARRERPDGRVAVLMRHDAPQFAAALAVTKAGMTAVVMNPTDPAGRLGRIRADTEPELLICDERNREPALDAGFAEEDVLAVPERPDASPHPPPVAAAAPDSLAFVIYTSGSAGEPKGVMQTHRNVLHNVLRQSNGLEVEAGDRIAMLAPLSGGQGLGVTFTALLNGATLLPFPAMERGVAGLGSWLEGECVTVLSLPASVFRHFVRGLDGRRLTGVRLVRLGSEVAVGADFEAYRRHFAEPCRLANLLSSTETGNITQCLFGADAEVGRGSLPVGRPAEGMEVLLLDESGAEVPPGEVGELAVRSRYLSPGYWRDAAAAGERSGFGESSDGSRVFRTGDLARADRDGSLTVLGREDDRVKIRGNRVELSEVQTAIAAAPEVAAAAVMPDRTSRGETRLTGFVVVHDGADLDAEGLRRRLGDRLPAHAIPGAFVFLDSLPLSANGKLDRRRLAELAGRSRRQPGLEPPRGETEQALARIWAQVFELERVGRQDDFFALDGDSLTAAEIAAEVAAVFGVELELDSFAEGRTLASMAELVARLREGGTSAPAPPLVRVPPGEPLPASFAQERMWRNARSSGDLRFNVSMMVRIAGPLDVGALRRSLDQIVRRHQTLRTTFAERDGRLLQVIHPAQPLELPLIEPRGDPRQAASELLDEQACTPFDLERGPLLRLHLVRVSAEEHLLIRSNHHIVSDGPSWELFFDELGVLYEAHRAGEPPPLPDRLPLRFADFAAWERSSMPTGSPRYREELAWWRRELEGSEPPRPLPFARPAMTAADASEAHLWWTLRPVVSRRLDRLAREAGATYYMVRLAMFAAQLAVETDNDEPVLLILKSNRGPKELKGVFGPLFNPTFLRLRFDPELSFREWLDLVRARVGETRSHSQIPHEELLDELRAEGLSFPGAHAAFTESRRVAPRRFGGLEVTHLRPAVQAMPRGFAFSVDRREAKDHIWVLFDARFYDPAGVRAFASRFRALAAAAGGDPDRRAGELVAAAARRARLRSRGAALVSPVRRWGAAAKRAAARGRVRG